MREPARDVEWPARVAREKGRGHEPPVLWERATGSAGEPLGPRWRRRQPEKTALWKLVASELPGFLARIGEESGHTLPGFIARELQKYLACGLLQKGFARVRCQECKQEILVAFSCRGRGLCPSCTTRRMADVAAHLVDRVVPKIPIRQWVITFPRRVRWHLAHDPKLAAEALTLCLRVLFAWQRRTARGRGIALGAPKRSQSARSAAVAFTQRFDSSLALDWHAHTLIPDGIFARESDDPEARPRFHRLPAPTDGDVSSLLGKIAGRVIALLKKRGRLDDDADTPADLLPMLQLAASRPLQSGGTPPPPPPLCARLEGFSLHAAVAIHENDREGLERVARYCARPALALERLSLTDEGQVRYRMKRTFSNGMSEVLLPPHDFLVRLCALIPPPRVHLVRYYGAFSAHAQGRAALVGHRGPSKKKTAPTDPKSPEAPTPSPTPSPQSDPPLADPSLLGAPPADPSRPRRLPWADLLQRVYKIDVLTCATCGGRLRVIAFLTDENVTRRILDHLGITRVTAPEHLARPPPPPQLHFSGIDPIPDDPGIDPPLTD